MAAKESAWSSFTWVEGIHTKGTLVLFEEVVSPSSDPHVVLLGTVVVESGGMLWHHGKWHVRTVVGATVWQIEIRRVARS